MFHFVETQNFAPLQLKNLLEIFHAMFAQRAFEIGWEGFSFIDIATHLAHPATFAVLRLLCGLGFGLDVLLIIVVGHAGLVGQHLGIKHVGDEHGMRAEVDALGNTASQKGISVFRDVEHMVDGTVFRLAVCKFVHLASRLEAEVLEDLHWRLGSQHADVEHAGVLDEVVGVVALVDRHCDLQGVARDLYHRVDDAAVVDVVVVGGQHIKAVADVE